MFRLLKMMILFVITSGFLFACSDGGGTATVPLVADSNGKITTNKEINVSGVVGIVPAGLVLTDANGAPLSGNLNMDITTPTTTGITPPAGTTTAAYISFKITNSSKTEAKYFSGTPASFPVTIDVQGAKAGDNLNLYTSNDGSNWLLESTIAITTDGKATFTITHLSYWGLFKSTTATKTISGKVVQTIPSGTADITDGVAIQINSFDKNAIELDKAATTSDNAGGVSAALKLSPVGGYITINATKEGYTEYQKRIDYKAPEDIEFQAILENTTNNTVIASPSTPLAAGLGKSSIASFNFVVVRYPSGAKKALAGTAIKAAKAAGAITEVGITIPQDTVPGVSKLKGELMTYDPNSQSDRFPGSYTGIDASGKEGKMVSLAFDNLKITNADTGENIGKVAAKLAKAGISKAAATSTTYTRHIYSNSCDNLFIEDYDTTAVGHQVPVWSLNPSNGKWVLIGIGDVVDSNGALIEGPTKDSCSTNGNYYLKILVSNTEFQKSWWNLDHIVFTTPTFACLEGNFKFDDGSAVTGLSLSLNGSNIEGMYVTTDSNGAYKFEAALLNKNNSKRDATLYYYDQNGYYKSNNVTLGTTPCGSFSKTDIPKPCEVSGKLVDDSGAGVPNRYIRLQSSDYSFYRSAGGDSNGDFSTRVACGKDINLYFGGNSSKSATFNVNAVVGADESSDASNKTVLKNITAPNIPPTGYAYFTMRSIKVGNAVTVNLSAYDEDKNYPLTYTLTINNDNTIVATKTGSIAASDALPIPLSFTYLSAGDYTAKLEVKDSKGEITTAQLGQVTVSDGSRPPIVDLSADRLNTSVCNQSRSINLYGRAFDPDGDSLSGVWSRGQIALETCTGGIPSNSSIAAACTDVLPTTSGPFTYRYTVTDNSTAQKSAYKELTVSTYNNKPWVQLTTSKNLVPEGATGTGRTITLRANANDADGDALNGSWSVDGTSITGCSGGSGNGNMAATCDYTIPSTATIGQTYKFVFTAADCATSGTNSVNVTYGAAGDVNVVVQ